MEWNNLELLWFVQRFTSACSLIGSCTVCWLFYYFKWWNASTHYVILICVSISDIFWSLSVFWGPWTFDSRAWCTIQGWMGHMFGLSGQLWCTLLGVNLYLQMNFMWQERRCRQLIPYYHAFAWGVPFILATIPAAQDFMVPLSVWCWISTDQYLWQLWGMYVPLWLNFIVNLYIIIQIIRILRRVIADIPEDMDKASEIKAHYKFITCHTLMFVFAGMFCWGVYLFSAFWQVANNAVGVYLPYTLWFVIVLLIPLQGLVNLLVYVAPSHLRNWCWRKNKMRSSEKRKTRNTRKKFQNTKTAIEVDMVKVSLEDEEFQSDEESSVNLGDTLTQFERMTFYGGPGEHGIIENK